MSFLAAAAVPHPPILLPEVGHGDEKKLEKTTAAYRTVMRRLAELRPDTVIITSPHSVMYSDYFHISPGASAKGDMGAFRADGVKLYTDYDTEFVEKLAQLSHQERLPAGTLGERNKSLDHGSMIPLYFLQKVYSDFQTVRIGLSGLSPIMHYRLGQCIVKTAEALNRRVVLLASGDLSHKLSEHGPYGFAPEGKEFDKKITGAFAAGDFLTLLRISPELADAAGECGLRSFHIMAGALDCRAVKSELLSYEGPFGVGYGVALFEVMGDDPSNTIGARYETGEREKLAKRRAREDSFVRLARLSIETYIKTGKPAPLPEDLPANMLKNRAGTFVSLKKQGRLRGCIGTISATAGNIAQEIMQNAVSAAAKDPRFRPVTKEELDELVYSVDVLGEAEEIGSPGELDVKRYGVIVQSGSRRGLLLPNLEGVSSVEEQIRIAKEKAGIQDGEPVRLFRFEVVRHL